MMRILLLLPARSGASAILLVRHAERAPKPAEDPGLTPTGPERAQALALGGEPHGPIAEAWEYDRLYVLTPGTDGSMGTLLLRYGPVVVRP